MDSRVSGQCSYTIPEMEVNRFTGDILLQTTLENPYICYMSAMEPHV